MRRYPLLANLILAIMLFSIAIISNADSDQYGTIRGKIYLEGQKTFLGNATVTIEGTNHSTTTNKFGYFKFDQVPVGQYTLSVSHESFETFSTIVFTVETGKVTNLVYGVQFDYQQIEETDRDLSTTITVKAEKELKKQKVTTVDELLSCVTGVVASPKHNEKIFIRGGRAAEVNYFIDNVAVNSPAHGGTSIVNNEPFDAMFFKNYGVNPFVDTEDDHLSTFAIDVDEASYVMARSYLERGAYPPDEAIRVEEFVNHFKYNYESSGESPFDFFFEGAPSKFGQNSYLVRVGIKGRDVAPENRKPANLVFVVDVSGSMGGGNRLGLVRQSLRLLVDELTPNDKVGIVVYGNRGREILRPTSDKNQIISAIEQLYPNGSTNAEEGIRLGYEMMDRTFETGKINRVILCSDGVANVGRTGPDQILEMIKKYADKGITLSSIGFGMGNYNDIMLEKLGNKGNGYYAYVDNLEQAKKIFVDNLTGTLQVIARDVKIQVDFNPAAVRSYRLLGYENRDVADEKFRDDKEDGGEVGAGHCATALYEVKFKVGALTNGDFGTIYLRYKDPDDLSKVTEIKSALSHAMFSDEFEQTSFDFRLAACAAEFSEILRKSYWAKGATLTDLMTPLKELVIESNDPDIVELYSLVVKADKYKEQRAEK